ncbi:hypothetical protein M231_02969 [Tremella mesenterica]|uniref:CRAL-TRIO domain-containing protein n=1 Tax=Tremella mesenterica TaxID=5217 RepID=A0A4Q1BPE9_TREME|nr:hypothetical protein M231_02969 [Tremella mesenterica]
MTSFPVHLLSPPTDFAPPPPPVLNPAQMIALKDLETHFGKEGFVSPVKEDDEAMEGLNEVEMMFLSKETFIRFLTGCKWDVLETIARLEKTIVWRRTEKIDDVKAMADDCAPESETGKNIVLGFTSHAQPIIYFFPHRNTTPVEKRRAVHAVFMLERAKDLMSEGVNNTVVIFNFSGKRQGPPTNIGTARATLHILSHHYPETLAFGIFQDLPWIVKAFVNLMWPFVDPVTKHKTRFGSAHGNMEMMKEAGLSKEVVLSECGGSLEWKYDHTSYWPKLIETCLRKRSADLERWRSGPRTVGRSEREFRKHIPLPIYSEGITDSPEVHIPISEDVQSYPTPPAPSTTTSTPV